MTDAVETPARSPAPRRNLIALLGATPGGTGALLAAFAFGSALILSLADEATKGAIAERAAEDLQASLVQVIPDDLHDNDPGATLREAVDPVEGPVRVHIAARGRDVTAVAFELTGYGYGGAIEVLMGVDPDGTLIGARVLSHAETPGLGDKIETAKSAWVLDFTGRSLSNTAPAAWALKRDGGAFDQFSGASITPRAVVGAVHRGLEFFDRNRAALTAPLSAEEAAR